MSYCSNCGSKVHEKAVFCSNCGVRLEMYSATENDTKQSTPQKQTEEPHPGEAAEHVTAAATVGHMAVKSVRNLRVLTLCLIAFAIGMALVFTGLAGRTLMARTVSEIKKVEFIQGNSALVDLVNKAGQRESIKFFKALVQDDYSGFVNAAKDLTGAAEKMVGDSYGVGSLMNLFVGLGAEAAFEMLREKLIEKAGPYWNVLQAMVYYQDILLFGCILAALGALAWFLLEGRMAGPLANKLRLALLIPAVYGVLMLAASNIAAALIHLS